MAFGNGPFGKGFFASDEDYDYYVFEKKLNTLSDDPPNDDYFDHIKALKRWFTLNYERPSVTGEDSTQGGGVFRFGGPFDAHEVFKKRFPKMRSDILEQAVREVEMIFGVDEFDGRDPEKIKADKLNSARKHLLKHTAEIEKALQNIPKHHGGLGHNNPPDVYKLINVWDDIENIKAALTVLKTPLPIAAPNFKEFDSAVSALQIIDSKLDNIIRQNGKILRAGDAIGASRKPPSVFTDALKKRLGERCGDAAFVTAMTTLYYAMPHVIAWANEIKILLSGG